MDLFSDTMQLKLYPQRLLQMCSSRVGGNLGENGAGDGKKRWRGSKSGRWNLGRDRKQIRNIIVIFRNRKSTEVGATKEGAETGSKMYGERELN